MEQHSTPQHQHQRLRIGEVAERAGLSLSSVRRFEGEGLFSHVALEANGDPVFDERAVERLALVKLMQPLGFSMETMRSMVDDWSRLVDDSTDDRERAAACERLRGYARRAAARHDAIRSQLVGAGELMRALEDAVDHAEQHEHVPTVAEAVEAIYVHLPELGRPLPFDIVTNDRDW